MRPTCTRSILRKLGIVLLPVAIFLPAAQCFSQQNVIIEMSEIHPQELKSSAFEVSGNQTIQIEATCLHTSREGDGLNEIWILNSRTRDVVWEMSDARIDQSDHTYEEIQGSVELTAGQYEVYFSFFPYREHSWRADGFGNFMGDMFEELFGWENYGHRNYRRKDFERLNVKIKGNGRALSESELGKIHQELNSGALIAMAELWDDEFNQQGFVLDRPMELEIYAIGEARHDGEYDYGWIQNTKTGEKVWQFTHRNSEAAGGAEKNRIVETTISLPAGTYAAFFATDDSHSPRRWNSPPPDDPVFWGLTIRVKDPKMAEHAKTYEYQAVPDKNVVLQFTRLRDDEFRTKGFTLKKPMTLRVYAIGEGRNGEMFDYGWIVDTKNHEKIWSMDFDETEHAGGSEKNRMADKIVRLEEGNYMAYFVTDGSHSFRDWNAAQPFDPEHWGLTIVAADEKFDPSEVAEYEQGKEGEVSASLVGMKDREGAQTAFSLKKDTKVRIYAMGEGSDGDMYDYGWIESENGRVIWEMTYRMTEHAGGAHKNRFFNGTIVLPKGDYTLNYRSDGSHSCNDWNDDAPHDPAHWGITVYAEND